MRPKTMQDVVSMLLDEGFETTAEWVRLAKPDQRRACDICETLGQPMIEFKMSEDGYTSVICADRPACHAREEENERRLLDAVVLCEGRAE